MYGITTSHFTRAAAPPSSAPNMPSLSNNGGSGFQAVAAGDTPVQATVMVLRASLSTASPTLGAQTVSTLLQTQEINQTPIHGGHGGGGGHHGGQMGAIAQAEIAEESEETQMLNRRKKLLQEMKADEVKEAAESGEASSDDVEQNDPGRDDKKAG